MGRKLIELVINAKTTGLSHVLISPEDIFVTDSGNIQFHPFSSLLPVCYLNAVRIDPDEEIDTVLGLSKELSYISPEVVAKVGQNDPIWSLGIIIFEVFKGRLPFPKGEDVFESIKNFETEDLSSLPSRLKTLLKLILTASQCRISPKEALCKLTSKSSETKKTSNNLKKSSTINQRAMFLNSKKSHQVPDGTAKRPLKLMNNAAIKFKSVKFKKTQPQNMEIEDSPKKTTAKINMDFMQTFNFKSNNAHQFVGKAKTKHKKGISSKEFNFQEEIKESTFKPREGKFVLKRKGRDQSDKGDILPGMYSNN